MKKTFNLANDLISAIKKESNAKGITQTMVVNEALRFYFSFNDPDFRSNVKPKKKSDQK